MTRFSSIFSQLLQLFPRLEFEQAVKEHHAERSTKGFSKICPIRGFNDDSFSVHPRGSLVIAQN